MKQPRTDTEIRGGPGDGREAKSRVARDALGGAPTRQLLLEEKFGVGGRLIFEFTETSVLISTYPF